MTTSIQESCDSERDPLLHKIQDSKGSSGLPARYCLALMAFLGFFNIYCMRVNLSVALVAMVNSTSSDNSSDSSDQCPDHSTTTSNSTVASAREFNWDANTQALVLGAFFYGCAVTQIPGGMVAERIGGKRLLGYGCLVTAVLTLLTPVAARAGVPYLVTLRVLEGMGEGVAMPAMHSMWAVWAPLYERSKLAAFTYSGAQLGTVFAMPISGILCQHGFAGGWPSVFYIFGAMGVVWVALWMWLVHDSPAKHPRITRSERRYIEGSLCRKRRLPIPWKSIVTSGAVWAIIVANFTNHWGFYSMLTCLPTFMSNILHFQLTQNGALSALPYVILWLTQMTSGTLADYIRRRGYLSTATTRKLLNTVGQLCPACLLVATSYAGCDHSLAVALLTVGVGGGGFTLAGYAVNHLDIAPQFAGTLMGITNGIATIPGFLGPTVVGLLTNHRQTVLQWRQFFFITAGIYLTGTVAFLLLGKGEEQSWAQLPGTATFTSTYNQECLITAPPVRRRRQSYHHEYSDDYDDSDVDGEDDDDKDFVSYGFVLVDVADDADKDEAPNVEDDDNDEVVNLGDDTDHVVKDEDVTNDDAVNADEDANDDVVNVGVCDDDDDENGSLLPTLQPSLQIVQDTSENRSFKSRTDKTAAESVGNKTDCDLSVDVTS